MDDGRARRASPLEEWVKEVSRQTDTEIQYSIGEEFKRTIFIGTSYLSEVRDILHSSSYWSTTHILSKKTSYMKQVLGTILIETRS